MYELFREPATPLLPAAEAVATLLCGSGTASLGTDNHPGVDVLHARDHDGTVLVLAGADYVRELGVTATGDDVPARLDIASYAPLPDLTIPRAIVQVVGWVRAVPASEVPGRLTATCYAGDFGTAFRSWPGARLLALDVAEVSLHRSTGCEHLEPEDVVAALPDPLARQEAESLARLQETCGERLLGLVRALGHAHTADRGRDIRLGDVHAVRATAVDRCGLTVRCTGVDRGGDSNPQSVSSIRIAFPQAVRTVDEAVDALALLALGQHSCAGRCPYL